MARMRDPSPRWSPRRSTRRTGSTSSFPPGRGCWVRGGRADVEVTTSGRALPPLVMPDGQVHSLDQFTGLNQIGETGLDDQVNRHYWQVFGASLAVGALSGLAQFGTRTGSDMNFGEASRQAAGASLATTTARILDRYLNVLPTVTIREGYRDQGLPHERSRPARLSHRSRRCPMKTCVTASGRHRVHRPPRARPPAHAQFGFSIVYDPANYTQAVAQVGQYDAPVPTGGRARRDGCPPICAVRGARGGLAPPQPSVGVSVGAAAAARADDGGHQRAGSTCKPSTDSSRSTRHS